MKIKKSLQKLMSLKAIRESFMIIFSVLLALFVNQLREEYKEINSAENALISIESEINKNLTIAQEWYTDHKITLHNIDSIQKLDNYTDMLYYDNQLNFDITLPNGYFIRRIISSSAWETAQSTGSLKPIELKVIQKLHDLYNLHNIILKSLDMINQFYFSESIYDKSRISTNMAHWKNMVNMMKNQEHSLIREYKETLKVINEYKNR
jgi:hypothetical protein